MVIRITLFIFLFLGIHAPQVFAQSAQITQTSTSTFTFSGTQDFSNNPNTNAFFIFYKNTYPQTNNQTSFINAPTYNFPLSNIFQNLGCISLGNFSFSCNMESVQGSFGDGTYWVTVGSNQVQQQNWYNLIRNNGIWTINQVTATTTQSRIVSISPTVTSSSTTQTYSVNYISATPAPSKICLNWKQEIAYASTITQSKCEDIFQSGTFTFSTSTTLTNGIYTWWATLITGTSTIISQSIINTVNIGPIPWNPYTVDYRDSTSTTLTTDQQCDLFGNSGGWNTFCKIVMTVFAMPGAILTNFFNGTMSLMYNIPPLSWMFQIRDAVVSNTYQKQQIQGVIFPLPLSGGNTLSLMDEQFITNAIGQTNVNLIRGFVTTFTSLIFFFYLYNIALYRVLQYHGSSGRPVE